MKPAPFAYARPDSVAEAVAALAEGAGGARVLAGGQSLMAMLNMRLLEPSVLVDVSALAALAHVERRPAAAEGSTDGSIEVGAAVTQAQLLAWPELHAAQPLLAMALPWVGHYQTRTRGTVCGSLAHADPSSELPLVLAVLDGEVVLESVRGRRTLSADAFQTGMMSTALADDELLVAARFPCAAPGTAAAFVEVSQRHGDFAMVAAAVHADARTVRLGIGGVADVPAVLTLPWAEAERHGELLNEFAWSLGAADDIHATARYRRELVRRLGRRLLQEIRDALP